MKATLDMEKTANSKFEKMVAERFASGDFDQKRMKSFAAEVARLETGGFKVIDFLPHGTPPFWDTGMAHFHVPRDRLEAMLQALLKTKLNPHIIINGIPADILKARKIKDDLVDVRVMVGGR